MVVISFLIRHCCGLIIASYLMASYCDLSDTMTAIISTISLVCICLYVKKRSTISIIDISMMIILESMILRSLL